MKTRAMRLYGKNDIRTEEFELPEMKDDEILAKVVCDSICMSSHKAALQGADHKRVPNDIAENPVYMTLNLCRVLAYLRDGAVLSKKQGGEWGLAKLPERWHPQIRAALAAYTGESAEFPADLQEFAAFMLGEIRAGIS